jgi:hypothetical protein
MRDGRPEAAVRGRTEASHNRTPARVFAPWLALTRRLEQPDWVPVGSLDLNLFAGGTNLHVVPKMEADPLQRLSMKVRRQLAFSFAWKFARVQLSGSGSLRRLTSSGDESVQR